MSINIKKYTKDQMAKMVEDAQAEVQELRRVNAALTEQISQEHRLASVLSSFPSAIFYLSFFFTHAHRFRHGWDSA